MLFFSMIIDNSVIHFIIATFKPSCNVFIFVSKHSGPNEILSEVTELSDTCCYILCLILCKGNGTCLIVALLMISLWCEPSQYLKDTMNDKKRVLSHWPKGLYVLGSHLSTSSNPELGFLKTQWEGLRPLHRPLSNIKLTKTTNSLS